LPCCAGCQIPFDAARKHIGPINVGVARRCQFAYVHETYPDPSFTGPTCLERARDKSIEYSLLLMSMLKNLPDVKATWRAEVEKAEAHHCQILKSGSIWKLDEFTCARAAYQLLLERGDPKNIDPLYCCELDDEKKCPYLSRKCYFRFPREEYTSDTEESVSSYEDSDEEYRNRASAMPYSDSDDEVYGVW
jgi:hypothetical protein